MMNGIKSMQEAVERIRDAQNVQIFQNELLLLKEYMKNIGMEKEDLLKLERTAYYIKNEYSDKDTKENMEAAKERVVRYIEDIIYDNTDDESLLKILGNFYLFLEALLERVPDKRGGIQQEKLALLKIENEYDVQHLLYANIKSLYPMARIEVSEDSGYGTEKI